MDIPDIPESEVNDAKDGSLYTDICDMLDDYKIDIATTDTKIVSLLANIKAYLKLAYNLDNE